MTTLVELVKARIEDNVTDLRGAVSEVADLAALIQANALPQRAVAAFVIPTGFNGGDPNSITGAFTQRIDETVAIVLVVQAPGDPTARSALAKVDALKDAVVAAVCGWEPSGQIGDFYAVRGRLVSLTAGAIWFQIDFAIQDQLRITTS